MKQYTVKHAKQLLSAVLTAALLIGGLAVGASAVTVDKFGDDHEAYDEWLFGDVNLDWKVDKVDYAMLKRAMLGTYTMSQSKLRRADINQNGEIDVFDYMMITRAVLGAIAPLGVTPRRELSPKKSDSLTDEELYEMIDREIEMATQSNTKKLVIRFQRITRETQAAELLASLGLPNDLEDQSIFTSYSWDTFPYRVTFSLVMDVPSELSLRETMFKLYRCTEIDDRIVFGDVFSPPC